MNVRPSAIIFQDERVLTLRYCYGDQEVYALPGGNPDPGECLSQALSRELHEELGVQTEVNHMALCGEVIWPEVKKETLHIVFLASITEGIPALNPVHTSALEMVWLPLAELDSKLLYPNVGKQIIGICHNAANPGHIGVIEQPYIK
ncbi:NUDIX hydrolase [Dyadobacter chenwenxiniae]|uniref:NUDIX hydrolase n=1 Tax=Dyadobacter chenwenxiniae TaxID=2906456 RepID=A0A9X1PJY2_9BACT|nr:NUDIX hydrolase [Dyadobacter chenwenxiniae]MCF0049720.1 NUDIX hydrolase [Dyadobacter chenwenxiniae]MCF0062146.1 NUDIX hydrolase [Dyadobacter chenwenxiniae]UON81950.1 NUDIX hydrolase [Dyadobacter chenwenxiniae]